MTTRSFPPIDPEALPVVLSGGLTFDGELAFEEPEEYPPCLYIPFPEGERNGKGM